MTAVRFRLTQAARVRTKEGNLAHDLERAATCILVKETRLLSMKRNSPGAVGERHLADGGERGQDGRLIALVERPLTRRRAGEDSARNVKSVLGAVIPVAHECLWAVRQ